MTYTRAIYTASVIANNDTMQYTMCRRLSYANTPQLYRTDKQNTYYYNSVK